MRFRRAARGRSGYACGHRGRQLKYETAGPSPPPRPPSGRSLRESDEGVIPSGLNLSVEVVHRSVAIAFAVAKLIRGEAFRIARGAKERSSHDHACLISCTSFDSDAFASPNSIAVLSL
jgi:hypothetical protein